MVNSKLRLLRTEREALISNFRGEVGEVITTWILLRHFMAVATSMQTDDLSADMRNQELGFLNLLRGKLTEDLVAKLSELGDTKIARTNFYFASRKVRALEQEVKAFADFIVVNKFKEKRNKEIAHREQPENWPTVGSHRIGYRTLVKATAMAVRLMKRFDQAALGPGALVQWNRMRRKRYDFTGPPRAMYLLLPYMADPVKDEQEPKQRGQTP